MRARTAGLSPPCALVAWSPAAHRRPFRHAGAPQRAAHGASV